MKTLLAILGLAGTIAIADAAVEHWAGVASATAQSRKSSACVQNCMNVRNWPAAQCRQYCKGKS
jgi:hypothetical protein